MLRLLLLIFALNALLPSTGIAMLFSNADQITPQTSPHRMVMTSSDSIEVCLSMKMPLSDCTQMLDDTCEEKCTNSSHCTQVLGLPISLVVLSLPAYSSELIDIFISFSTRSISPDSPPPLV